MVMQAEFVMQLALGTGLFMRNILQAFTTRLSRSISVTRTVRFKLTYPSILERRSERPDMSVSNKPNFASGLDSPNYRVVERTADFELREYEETKWVLTDMPAKSYWEDKSQINSSFYKLFRYITGNNAASQKIPMTAPVKMAHSQNSVTMEFMVPHNIENNIPQPTDYNVKVHTVPRQFVFVRSFGGFARGFFGNKNYFKEELEALRTALDRDGKNYEPKAFFTAQYNSPWDLFNRHNEVWVPKL